MKGILGRDSREFLAFFLSLPSIVASNCLCDSLISPAHSKGSNWYIGNRNDMFLFLLCCVAAIAMLQQRLFSLLCPLRHHQSNGRRLTFDRWSQYFVISGSCSAKLSTSLICRSVCASSDDISALNLRLIWAWSFFSSLWVRDARNNTDNSQNT